MKKFLCSIMLVSMVMLTACGNSSDKATAAEPTDKEIEEAFERIDAAEAASAEAAEAAAASDSEYPSISKVTYDSLFSVVDKDELRQFATDYIYDNDPYKDMDNFEAKYLGTVFESIGVPETDNFTNLLMYVFKVTTNNEEKYAIHIVIAKDISFVSDGKVSDIIFNEDEYIANLKDIYSMDKSQYEAMLSDPEQTDMTTNGIAASMTNPSIYHPFFDPKENVEFYTAYADGNYQTDYHLESDGFDDFIQHIHDKFFTYIDLRLAYAYPDKVGQNTGTYSQN